MKKLEIQLNQEYRSFQNNFKTTLEGDLVILSGVNGSGKTQLFDIIRGFQKESRAAKVSRSVQIDGAPITEDHIAHRSIRDYANVSELTQGSARIIEDQLNNLWQWYQQYNLNPGANQVGPYIDACKRARELLVEKITEDRFNKKDILRDDFNAIFEDFVLYQDDIFTNKIGEIFFRFTTDREQKIIDAYNSKIQFDEETLPPTPWARLNELLDKLKFGYKFKNNYKNRNHALSEQPALFTVNSDGIINESERRTLQDLSDGEKAIISLTFAMLASEDTHPKILILDEYDAPLNPSLINAFFTVLKDFFIDKGVQVVLATHSPATLSLAPDYAVFYEVFKKDIPIQGRLLRVEREQYAELKVANQRFVDRINELQDEVIRLNEKIQSGTIPLIITEGKSDIKHLRKAKEKLDIKDYNIDLYEIDEESFGDSKLRPLLDNLAKLPQSRKIIGIFDRDVEKIVQDIEKDGQQYKDHGNNVYAFCIPVPQIRESYKNISIEFFYSDVSLKKQKDGKCLYFDNEINFDSKRQPLSAIENTTENIAKKIWDENIGDLNWIHSKARFAELVETDDEFTSDFDFSNFSLIFDKIKSIISKDAVSTSESTIN